MKWIRSKYSQVIQLPPQPCLKRWKGRRGIPSIEAHQFLNILKINFKIIWLVSIYFEFILHFKTSICNCWKSTHSSKYKHHFFSNQAQALHASGAEVIAIGIGNSVSNPELKAIASDSSHVFQVQDFNLLNSIQNHLTNATCQQAALRKCHFFT